MTGQNWDARSYVENAGFVSALGEPVLDLLAPAAGERILDLGCGEGALTERLLNYGCEVVTVDSAPSFIEAAARRGLDARLMDAQALTFEQEFDAVFSNAALHWMLDADAVVAGVRRALRPGGRFVAEFGGAGNVAAVIAALSDTLAEEGVDAAELNPWFFPSPDAYRARLEAQGFEVREIDLFPRPTPLPGALRAWLATFAQSFTASLSPERRDDVYVRVEQRLFSELCDATGCWHVDYVRLRFAAFLP